MIFFGLLHIMNSLKHYFCITYITSENKKKKNILMSSMFSYSCQMVNKHYVYMFTFTSIHGVKADLICVECFCVSLILWSWIDSCCFKFTDKSQNFPSAWNWSLASAVILLSSMRASLMALFYIVAIANRQTHQCRCLILTMLTLRNVTSLV